MGMLCWEWSPGLCVHSASILPLRCGPALKSLTSAVAICCLEESRRLLCKSGK
ncbi:mCG147787 [Mus musculus]|nr:mCG147787 [Mus musculus]